MKSKVNPLNKISALSKSRAYLEVLSACHPCTELCQRDHSPASLRVVNQCCRHQLGFLRWVCNVLLLIFWSTYVGEVVTFLNCVKCHLHSNSHFLSGLNHELIWNLWFRRNFLLSPTLTPALLLVHCLPKLSPHHCFLHVGQIE